MNFKETSIPANYSLTLKDRASMDWSANDADKIYGTLIAAISQYLATVKSKKIGSTAVVVNDLKGNFLLAGIVTYHENENADMPGNWSYELTFNESDIKDVEDIRMSTDTQFDIIAANAAFNLYSMKFMSQLYMQDMFITAIDTLIKYLDENAREGETVDVELTGYFTASVEVCDGKKIMSIVPDGAMKRVIKDDAAL